MCWRMIDGTDVFFVAFSHGAFSFFFFFFFSGFLVWISVSFSDYGCMDGWMGFDEALFSSHFFLFLFFFSSRGGSRDGIGA